MNRIPMITRYLASFIILALVTLCLPGKALAQTIDSDGDGLPDDVDPFPTDYYNNSVPTLAIVSGANQATIIGRVLAEPIVVRVTDSYGQLLGNAPLFVTASSAGATFSD